MYEPEKKKFYSKNLNNIFLFIPKIFNIFFIPKTSTLFENVAENY